MSRFGSRAEGVAVRLGAVVIAAVLASSVASEESARPPASAYRFTADNRLEFPSDYREWIFLSAGHGMTYGPSANPHGPPLFDNVFVNPAAYRDFLKSGHWPDHAIFVLEIRKAVTEGSINQGGHFQKDVVSVEVEIKDRRFADSDGWGFFEFDPDRKPVQQIAKGARCYTCHSAHGAVEQTFVQFYPTLIPVAEKYGTLKPRTGTTDP